jgi:AcrR family transcriptional regulator
MGVNGAGPSAKQAVRVGPSRKPGAGRRRDPTIDDRLRHAARMLYGREGWAGFHFEGVAKAAGVSKDAVYRRYSDAQSLLLDALSDQTIPVLASDQPIEDALVDYACDVFRYFASGNGNANLRVHVDGGQYPEVLQEYRRRVVEPQIQQAVGVLEQAREGGEIHSDASLAAVMEALGGAVMVYALASSWRLDESGTLDQATVRQLTEFVQQILHGRLVDGHDRVRSSAAHHRRRPTVNR